VGISRHVSPKQRLCQRPQQNDVDNNKTKMGAKEKGGKEKKKK
jgi:hypothetical protein